MQPTTRAISLPFRIDSTGSFAVVQTEEQRIRDLVQSVLGTYFGERVMRLSFGSEILRYQFENFGSSLEISDDLEDSVAEALRIWAPTVELLNVTVNEGQGVDGLFTVAVDYRLGSETVTAVFDVDELQE